MWVLQGYNRSFSQPVLADNAERWFQQDEATAHTTELTMQLLKEGFLRTINFQKFCNEEATWFTTFSGPRLFPLGIFKRDGLCQ